MAKSKNREILPCSTREQWLRAWRQAPEGRSREKTEPEADGEYERYSGVIRRCGLEAATTLLPAPTVGKWLIFPGCAVVAECWQRVREGTDTGTLGREAKVAGEQEAQKTNPNPEGRRHVICVYTDDWRDVDDVLRVGRALVKLGAIDLNTHAADSERLYYKPDLFTFIGETGLRSIYSLGYAHDRLSLERGLDEWAQPSVRRILRGWAHTTDEANQVRRQLRAGQSNTLTEAR